MKKTAVYVAALTLALVALNGCSNTFLEKPQNISGGENIPTGEVPEGFGTVTVSLTRGTARTIMPEIELTNVYLAYLFTRDEGTAEEKTSDGGKFVLEPGSYSLTVQAFADGAKQNLVAQGTTDADFTITAGVDAETVSLSLHPVASGAGTGELEYRLEYPAGITVETLTLTRIAGEESPLDLTAGATVTATSFSGIKTTIPVGYYLLRAVVKNSQGVSTGRTEVAHIYQNLRARAEYVFIADDFQASWVTSAANTGPGSLRQVLVDMLAMTDGPQTIQVLLEPGTVIELESPLPSITKSLTIEGNGVTLTRAASWTAISDTSQLLGINGATAEVVVRRVHFKDSLALRSGGAIYSNANLTLESCIFSGNRVMGTVNSGVNGGAICSYNTLTIRGCTFYGNTSNYYCGAVFFRASEKTLTLTGNLFYGNTANSSYGYPVVGDSGIIYASYNVVDVALGTGTTQAGWAQGTGDTAISALQVSPLSFRPLYGRETVALLPAILPPDYPDTDFYGDPIHGGGAAGAIQPSTAYGGAHYYLELSVNGPLKGSVTVSPSPDADGFYPVSSTITITASPTGGYSLGYWLVNGVKTDTAPVNLSAHTWVQAVFGRAVTDFTDGEGSASTPGTLRHALTNAVNGDIITFIGATAGTTTITLESPLPEITKSLTIEGNGVTLTRAASWTAISDTSRLLGINGATAEVVVRRVHFKDSLALRSGGAIYSNANLTLESCIFSGNRVTASDAYGGALYSSYTLTLRGCTFYGNTSNYRGGAVYFSSSGTLILTGNLFYGNTAASGYPAVYSSGTVTASYNVVDVAFGTADTQAGWDAGTGDTAISAALPVSGTSFRLLYESEAGDKLPGTLPADYPDTDFYGNPIHGDGAAGAVQAGTEQGAGYYYLETSVNSSLRGNVTVNSPPDADGCYPAGSSITANSNSKYSFGYWLVNGVKTTTATLSLSAHSWIQAVFINPLVTDFTDGPGSASTPGTLRHALTNAQDGDIITFIGVTAGTTTIALESPLPEITTGLTIEGNGVTLTRAASWTAADSQLLVTYSPAEVLIRRVHFKDGLATRDGGAIYNNGGTLTLESCIFSGNRVMTLSTSYYGNGGGAICSNNTLTIRGCTFYGNTSNYRGGAVYFSSSGTLTLTGNLFYGNTAASSYPVVYNYNYSGTINASYNAVDVALGTANTQAGWTIGTGDTTISAALPVSPKSFRLLYGSEAGGKLPGTLPVDYPDTDFYGSPIHGGGTAGAVQAGTEQGAGYYYLEASVNNSLWGSVTVSPPPDADGLCPAGSTIITPSPAGGFSLSYWLVNEVTAGTAPFSLSAHSRVQAVFNRQVTVNIFTDGTEPGTLRYALANAQDGDRINMSGVTAGTTTITLGSALPEITKSLIIEGNGVTLTRAASWTAASTSQLLRIRNSFTEVLIRRVHFKDSRTTGSGGAIYTDGILTLESCIFSGNQVTSGNGGAITSGNNTLTIRGCTFYGNTASSSVGAVYFISMVTKTLTLTGNLFYGNTAPSKPVVSISSYDPLPPFKVISYNVVDRSFGTGDTQAGWDAGTGDTTFTALGISGTPVNTTSFVPVTELSGVLPSAPAGFPATDFYGATRTFPGAPGAVKAP